MTAVEHVTTWMKEFVEKEHPVFAGLPAFTNSPRNIFILLANSAASTPSLELHQI